jgi:uncharacterized protein (DUF1015 family)
MADLRPLAALRPRPELAGRICELPYDVVTTEEAACLARGNPLSFFRVSKPEIALPVGADPHDPAVYALGRQAFLALRRDGALVQDPVPSFYLYRQVMGAHTQTGLVALASCEAYRQGDIRRHELTRVDKEDDRVRHIEALDAQTGPAFLVCRNWDGFERLTAEGTAGPCAVDFVAADGVRHQAWALTDESGVRSVQGLFASVRRLYIADGHHRTAAASRVDRARDGGGGADRFLAVVFPHDQVQILPYHRLVRDLGGGSVEALLRGLRKMGDLRPLRSGTPAGGIHRVGVYLAGAWYELQFHESLYADRKGIELLDVALLQRHVLGPLLGIDDPRTSSRIAFVGGERGTAELESRVSSGEAICAFAMCPTRIEELLAVADAGEIMPPKSTWFEPKLRDGMFSYVLNAG